MTYVSASPLGNLQKKILNRFKDALHRTKDKNTIFSPKDDHICRYVKLGTAFMYKFTKGLHECLNELFQTLKNLVTCFLGSEWQYTKSGLGWKQKLAIFR